MQINTLFFLGSNRDSDEQLISLCDNWLQTKGQLTSKKVT